MQRKRPRKQIGKMSGRNRKAVDGGCLGCLEVEDCWYLQVTTGQILPSNETLNGLIIVMFKNGMHAMRLYISSL